MSSTAKATMGVDTLGELSSLFSPEYFVKKEELEPFVSLLNGIKHEYWNNAEKFRLVIGLLHELELDISTKALEYQQFLIRNRLSYLLRDTPELLDTLLEMISDASNNKRHVLNTRPVTVAFMRRQNPGLKKRTVFGTRPSATFVIRNNTVTLPWQPWFAHIVPKSSSVGRTVLRLQGGNSYSLLMPKSPPCIADPKMQLVTTAGLVTLQPAGVTTMAMPTNASTQSKEFEVSRRRYELAPSSLQNQINKQAAVIMEQSSTEHKRLALLKKQQEFLQQLALLKTRQNSNQGCHKRLFPPYTGVSASSSSLSTQRSPADAPLNLSSAGDNVTKGLRQGGPEQSPLAQMGNPRMSTRQSKITAKIRDVVSSSKRSPRNKDTTTGRQRIATKQKSGKVDKEKGLLLSRVSEHCVVISVPNQSSSTSANSTNRCNTQSVNTSSPLILQKNKRHRHRKKRHHKLVSGDHSTCSPASKAFGKVLKHHKKRHRAWMKKAAQEAEAAARESKHREVLASGAEFKSRKIKISSELFNNKHHLNKNNSSSTVGFNVSNKEMKTPGKCKVEDKSGLSKVHNEGTNLPSLVSPNCFVSLKKMHLDRDVQLCRNTNVLYSVDSSTSFSYCQQLSIPVNKCATAPLTDNSQQRHQNIQAPSAESDNIDVEHLDDDQCLESGPIRHPKQDQASVTRNRIQCNNTFTFNDVTGGSDTYSHRAPHSMIGSNCSYAQPVHKLRIHGSLMRNDTETGSHPNTYSVHSFLGRLLASPVSPTEKSQHVDTYTRQRRKSGGSSKVRKSKRQKRKHKRKEKESQVCCKRSKP